MNKRQKKKKRKKTLPLFADEYPLMTMTESELEFALEQAENYRLTYGYRKKYSNLKKEKYLHYIYSVGEKYLESLNKLYAASGVQKGQPTVIVQTLDQLLKK